MVVNEKILVHVRGLSVQYYTVQEDQNNFFLTCELDVLIHYINVVGKGFHMFYLELNPSIIHTPKHNGRASFRKKTGQCFGLCFFHRGAGHAKRHQ